MTMLAATSTTPNWFMIAMSLLGGLALFLFGLDQLSSGLKQAAGESLKTLLTRLTTNRFLGALTGAVVTGILNSSSVTTVLVVGFVTAGVMSLSQCVSVIMGANIGSTVTAQILAFNLSAYALLPVAAGFFMLFASKRDAIRRWGMMVMGLGLVFYGMGIMSDAMKPLRSYAPFVQTLARMDKPVYGIVAGAIFTGLVQSSAATVGLAIAMASEGLLTLPAGIGLALGANIGTCATALLAALGKPPEAVRAALVHVLFNALGVLLWLPFIGALAGLAVAISPASIGLEGTDRLAADVPRQIANANTLFNILNTLLFIGFTGAFARLATRLVPDRAPGPALMKPKFLSDKALGVPSVALEQVRQELARFGEAVRAMLVDLATQDQMPSTQTLDDNSKRAHDAEVLESAILQFLGQIRNGDLTQSESQSHLALMTIAVHFRGIADIIADDLADIVRKARVRPENSPALQQVAIKSLYVAIQRALELAVEAVRRQDPATAEAVIDMSGEVRQLADDVISRLAALNAGNPQSLLDLRLKVAFVDGLRQIFTLTKRISRCARPRQDLP